MFTYDGGGANILASVDLALVLLTFTTSGSGAEVSLLGSLSLRRAETCVTGVSKGSRLPNLRVWAMVWVGLCRNR